MLSQLLLLVKLLSFTFLKYNRISFALQISDCDVYRFAQEPFCEICSNGYKLIDDGNCTLNTTIPNCLLYSNNTSVKCVQCSSDSVMAPDQLSCFNNTTNCLTYSNAGICTQCILGFGMDQTNQCYNTVPYCLSYISITICQQCYPGRTLAGNDCLTKPADNCEYYDTSGVNCTICISGFKLINSTNQCTNSSVIPNCMIFKTNVTCLICQENYTITTNRTSCVNTMPHCKFVNPYNQCGLCDLGFESTPATNYLCQSIITNCILLDYKDPNDNTSQIICKQCQTGYAFNTKRDKCLGNVVNCRLYNELDQCILCNYQDLLANQGVATFSGQPSQQICVNNTNFIDQCKVYSPNDNTTCSECYYPLSFYVNTKHCQISPLTNCLVYQYNLTTMHYECLQCYQSYQPDQKNWNCYNTIPGCKRYQLQNQLQCYDCGSTSYRGSDYYYTNCVNTVPYCQYYIQFQQKWLCQKCYDNFYIQGGACYPMQIQNCQLQDKALCLKCNDFYALVPSQQYCISNAGKVQWCQLYDGTDNSTCLQCYQGQNYCWTIKDNQTSTQDCVSTKGLILNSNNICECQTGIYMTKIGIVNGFSTFYCEKCPNKCGNCTEKGTCINCKGNRNLNQDCTCPFGYYDDLVNPNCAKCPSRCQSCIFSLKCQSCMPFRNLVTDCACVSNSYQNGTNCICLNTTIAYKNTCLTSIPSNTYYDFTDQWGIQNYQDCPFPCLNCSKVNNIIKCKNCQPGTNTVLASGVCQCPFSSYLDQNTQICKSCPFKCADCLNDGTTCISCKGDRIPELNCACPESYFDDGVSKLCQPCPLRCRSCTNSLYCQACKQGRDIQNDCACITPGSHDVGQIVCECDSGYYKSNNYCINTCPTGYYSSQLSCQQCPNLCLNCSLTSFSKLECFECPASMQVQQDRCICTYGYYLEPSIKRCYQCPWKCDQNSGCSYEQSSNNILCQSCRGNRVYINNCECPQGTYENLHDDQCQACPAACQTCSSTTNCKTCKGKLRDIKNNCQCVVNAQPNPINNDFCICNNNFYFLKSNDSCLVSCPDGTFPNTNNQCQTCDKLCITCLGTPDTCIIAYNCLANEFYDRQKSVCTPCNPPCLTCSGVSECLNCLPSYVFYHFLCLPTCPAATYARSIDPLQPQQLCDDCSILCESCVQSFDNCITCKPFAFKYQQTRCLIDCPINAYKDYEYLACIDCNSICKTCAGPGPQDCLSCFSPLYLLDNECLSKCRKGYLPDDLSRQCMACQSKDREQENCKDLVIATLIADESDLNSVFITFSKPVQIKDEIIKLKNTLNVFIESDEKVIYSVAMSWYSTKAIKITIQRQISFLDSKLKVLFLDSEAFRDANDQPIDKSLEEQPLQILLRAQQTIDNPSSFEVAFKVVSFLFGGILIPFFMFGQAPESISLIETFQMINLLLYVKMNYPQNLEIYLKSLSVFNLDFFPCIDIANNRYSDMFSFSSQQQMNGNKPSFFGQEITDQQVPYEFESRGGFSASFFANGFGKVQTILIFWLAYALINYLCKRYHDKIIQQLNLQFKFNILLCLHRQLLIPSLFVVFLQFIKYSEVSAMNPSSYFIAILYFIYYMLYFKQLFTVCLDSGNQEILRNDVDFARRFAFILNDNRQLEQLQRANSGKLDIEEEQEQVKNMNLESNSQQKNGVQMYQMLFPVLNQILQFIYVAVIVGLQQTPAILIYFLMILQILWILLGYYTQPFENKFKIIFFLVNKSIIFVLLIIMLIFNALILNIIQLESDSQKQIMFNHMNNLGIFCIFIIILLQLGNFAYCFYNTFKYIRSHYQKANDNIQLQPMRKISLQSLEKQSEQAQGDNIEEKRLSEQMTFSPQNLVVLQKKDFQQSQDNTPISSTSLQHIVDNNNKKIQQKQTMSKFYIEKQEDNPQDNNNNLQQQQKSALNVEDITEEPMLISNIGNQDMIIINQLIQINQEIFNQQNQTISYIRQLHRDQLQEQLQYYGQIYRFVQQAISLIKSKKLEDSKKIAQLKDLIKEKIQGKIDEYEDKRTKLRNSQFIIVRKRQRQFNQKSQQSLDFTSKQKMIIDEDNAQR